VTQSVPFRLADQRCISCIERRTCLPKRDLNQFLMRKTSKVTVKYNKHIMGGFLCKTDPCLAYLKVPSLKTKQFVWGSAVKEVLDSPKNGTIVTGGWAVTIRFFKFIYGSKSHMHSLKQNFPLWRERFGREEVPHEKKIREGIFQGTKLASMSDLPKTSMVGRGVREKNQKKECTGIYTRKFYILRAVYSIWSLKPLDATNPCQNVLGEDIRVDRSPERAALNSP